MKVKDGSKIRNLMGYAIGEMELDSVRQILFTGSGKAVSKTITCVEIMKRRLKELHQITKVLFKQIEEIWEPIVPEAGLDALTHLLPHPMAQHCPEALTSSLVLLSGKLTCAQHDCEHPRKKGAYVEKKKHD
ncbi:UNVERIFIED_CONTAM: hypothetical protein H355_006638 [Colinus virginianus]|nr:hypothetical protein H355_006638 [Colinus virginianus]